MQQQSLVPSAQSASLDELIRKFDHPASRRKDFSEAGGVRFAAKER
jgi:hypothetical protein